MGFMQGFGKALGAPMRAMGALPGMNKVGQSVGAMPGMNKFSQMPGVPNLPGMNQQKPQGLGPSMSVMGGAMSKIKPPMQPPPMKPPMDWNSPQGLDQAKLDIGSMYSGTGQPAPWQFNNGQATDQGGIGPSPNMMNNAMPWMQQDRGWQPPPLPPGMSPNGWGGMIPTEQAARNRAMGMVS